MARGSGCWAGVVRSLLCVVGGLRLGQAGDWGQGRGVWFGAWVLGCWAGVVRSLLLVVFLLVSYFVAFVFGVYHSYANLEEITIM